MKKAEIARRLARTAGLTPGEAADRLDRAVSNILNDLRRGKRATLPGIGRFTRGRDGLLVFQQEGTGSRG